MLLNYFGQGALLLESGTELANPFYGLATGSALPFLMILATAATITEAIERVPSLSFSRTIR